MGFRSWIRRILRRRDAGSAHAPAFEQLERRVLLGWDIGLFSPGGPIAHPSFIRAIVATFQPSQPAAPQANDDIFSVAEDSPRTVDAPGVLANDQLSGQGEIILLQGPSHGRLELRQDGSFTYVPEPQWSGHDSFTYRLGLGSSVSGPATVFLPVTPVNDPPGFLPGGDVTVEQGSPDCQIKGWAKSISAGPPDESGQAVRFSISTDRPELFEVLPSILPDGTLWFKPAPGAVGAAWVTVIAQDDGGTANGGQDRSAPARCTITIGTPAPQGPARTTHVWLPTIRQDDTDNDGILVAQLIARTGIARDTNGVQARGLALVGADLSTGTWEYSTDAGRTWDPVVGASEGTPILLAADTQTRLRFVPSSQSAGTITHGLICRVWDSGGATNGSIRFLEAIGQGHIGDSRIEVGIVVNPVVTLVPSARGNSVKVYQRSSAVAVTDGQRTILELPLDAFEQLIVVGADRTSDRLTVDTGSGPLPIKHGILFEAGSGSDTLVLRGSPGDDRFEVYQDTVKAGELHLVWADLEEVQIEGLAGDDIYQIHCIGIPLVLVDSAGREMLDFFYALSQLNIDLSNDSGQWQQVLSGSKALALKGTLEDVMGTAWSDTIKGNSAANRIWGWCGDDTIYGGAGNDQLFGQAGQDRLFGQSGADLLFGNDGADRLDGGSGNDILAGGLGADILAGGIGQDILIGASTAFDDDPEALAAILSQWNSWIPYQLRVYRLTYGLPFVLVAGRTVLAGQAGDNVNDRSGPNWTFLV